MKLNRDTTVLINLDPIPAPIRYAIRALQQDWQQVFDTELQVVTHQSSNQIQIAIRSIGYDEGFRTISKDETLLIEGHDAIGVVYGVYHVCENILNIDPLQFWTDYRIEHTDEIVVPVSSYQSPEPTVRFRGWFINDEDCLIGWHDNKEISLETWERIYESLLRAGYNTVIPGTTADPDDPQMQLATDMGLWLTQHHAQPLGARLFREAYPGITPRIPEDIPRFKDLYLEAIDKFKDKKVVWSLGFRGQGDVAFFAGDPRYAKPEAQGKVISDMIQLQRQLVEEHTPSPHHFVHHVYSESATLYKQGHLSLDDDVIRVWADNGYGAMRARREWGPDPEISSYPLQSDNNKQSGIYYHVQFHDLQTAHRLTPYVTPQLIASEFQKIYDAGNIAYVIINTGNIRPHVFNLELLNRILHGNLANTADVLAKHEQKWASRYFPGNEHTILNLLYRYHQAFFRYGDHDDDLGGEELCYWGTRYAIRAVIRNQSVFDTHFSFPFLKGQVSTNREVFAWLIGRLETIMQDWYAIEETASQFEQTLPDTQQLYFKNLIQRHILFMRYSYAGFLDALYGVVTYMDESYQSAFIHFSDSKANMSSAWDAITSENDTRWQGFYSSEWLTGIRETIRWLETARGLCKIHGDTESWWSGWMLEAMGHEQHVLLATVNQALTDYDRLASALKMRRAGNIMPIDDLLG